jgi:hypothetical protein
MTKSLVVLYLASMLMLKWERDELNANPHFTNAQTTICNVTFWYGPTIQNFALFSIWSFNCFYVIASFLHQI